MDLKTIRAIAEMIRCAARMHGVELKDVEFTICGGYAARLDENRKLKRTEPRTAPCE